MPVKGNYWFLYITIVYLFTLSSGSQCAEKSMSLHIETAHIADDRMDHVVEGNTNFAADLHREISKVKSDANIFISPLSLATVLSMTLAGARENTEAQMAKVLGVADMSKESLHLAHKRVLSGLFEVANIANRIFVQQDYEVQSSFTDILENNYNSGCTKVDFSDSSVSSTINEWVKKETKNKILKLVDGLSANTRMVIANAVYFKSLWDKQFKTSLTEMQDFHVNENETVKVKMMYQFNKFHISFHESTNTDVLELALNDKKSSMLVFLPREASGLRQLEDQFGSAVLSQALSTMSELKVKLWLPAFKLEESYQLKSTLTALGMTDLFCMGGANLSGISEKNDLYASEVIHKSFIEVNEQGAEAAAASGIMLMKRSLDIQPTVIFRADRPFLFCILDTATKSILFLGRLARPQAVALPGQEHQEL